MEKAYSLENVRALIGKTIEVVFDRPLGSKHPKFEMIYPINYGYYPEMIAPDGDALDVYLLFEKTSLKTTIAKCVAIIHRLDDNEDKLVLVPVENENKITEALIRKETDFQEKYYKSVILFD